MSYNQEKPSQTFEEWADEAFLASVAGEGGWKYRDCWDAAFAAGVVSQQTETAEMRGAHFDELERIIKEQRARLAEKEAELAESTHAVGFWADKCRAYEVVVAAIRPFLGPDNGGELYSRRKLRAALAALDERPQ